MKMFYIPYWAEGEGYVREAFLALILSEEDVFATGHSFFNLTT